jgi:hypothetical protein
VNALRPRAKCAPACEILACNQPEEGRGEHVWHLPRRGLRSSLRSSGRISVRSRLTGVVSHGYWNLATGAVFCGSCHCGVIRPRKVCLTWNGCTVSWTDWGPPEVATPRPLKELGGASIEVTDGAPWELLSYVPGRPLGYDPRTSAASNWSSRSGA